MPAFNQSGLNLLKSFEGCKLTAYKDIGGVWTIGYGETEGVYPGQTITQEQADEMLMNSLKEFIDGVNSLVTTPISDNQFSALVCFSYNVGLQNLKKSMLLRCVNTLHYSDAAKQFVKWDHVNGIVSDGLLRRRESERDLFLAS